MDFSWFSLRIEFAGVNYRNSWAATVHVLEGTFLMWRELVQQAVSPEHVSFKLDIALTF